MPPTALSTTTLTFAIDLHLLVGLAVAVAVSLLISFLPSLQTSWGLTLVSVLGSAIYHWRVFTGFCVVCGIGYAAARWLGADANRARRWQRACFGIVILATVFTWGRVQHWDHPIAGFGPIPVVLYAFDMWLALRLVSLFWEVGSGTVEAPSFHRYVLWTCLPFTLGGPLLRFSQMPMTIQIGRGLWGCSKWWMDAFTAAAKFVLGIALGVGQHFLQSHWPAARLWNNAVGTFLTGPVGFYLTAAGYLQLMEVFGQPAGFKLPPSFNYPLGRENISKFWMNWNMTATFLFRDYLFYNRWGFRNYNVYFNTILLFTLVGLWHAANGYWILWGFLHGLLFSGYLIWRKYSNRLPHIPLRGTAFSNAAARVLTYVVVCMCWYLPSKIIQKLPAVSL
jgi:D-alanyl-lipoteichoic acid acyltransferase DltB (MBOAT superfamily)